MRPLRSRASRIAAACIAVALFTVMQNVLVRRAAHAPLDWEWSAFHPMVYWLAWGRFAPVVVRVAERHRIERGGARRAIAYHAGAMLLVAPLQTMTAFVAHWGLLRAAGAGPAAPLLPWLAGSAPSMLWGTLAGLVYYWLIVGLSHAFAYQRLYHAQRLAATRLEADLAAARLRALAAQLQPHFLFNTFNAIAVLAEEDPPRAVRVVRQLSELLRATLAHTADQQVSLAGELALTRRYLDIQQTRFGDRLHVDVDVEPAAHDALVPALLLQPLVENAIRHGVERSETGGCVAVRARRDGATLVVEVADDGPGLDAERARRGPGVGLANTQARLAHLYGDRHQLALRSVPSGGLVVHIELPLHTVATSPS